jgi:hypothetical protein
VTVKSCIPELGSPFLDDDGILDLGLESVVNDCRDDIKNKNDLVMSLYFSKSENKSFMTLGDFPSDLFKMLTKGKVRKI